MYLPGRNTPLIALLGVLFALLLSFVLPASVPVQPSLAEHGAIPVICDMEGQERDWFEPDPEPLPSPGGTAVVDGLPARVSVPSIPAYEVGSVHLPPARASPRYS